MTRSAKDYIIFPLDVGSEQEALGFVRRLAGEVGMFKVGLELFIRSGPEIIDMVRDAGGAGVFLDLKLHDIPATVSRAMSQIAEYGVALATVHCGESADMLRAAVAGAGGRVGVLGVTVLTSVSIEDIRACGFSKEMAGDLTKLVLHRASMARDAGCAGVVCSGREAKMIKETFGPDFLAVTPGIRPLERRGEKDDQHRVVTPGMAVANGSDYLVIGRPIRDARDPLSAVRKIAGEIEAALEKEPDQPE